MKHITDLNREINQQIIKKAKEIILLLLTHSITPIFLKRTGNLREGLCEDIAWRMIVDIDFIASKDNYPKVIENIQTDGDIKIHDKTKHDFPQFKQYPRLQKENMPMNLIIKSLKKIL